MISSLESHIEKFSYKKVAIIGAFRQGRKYNFKMIDLQVTEFDYISACSAFCYILQEVKLKDKYRYAARHYINLSY